MRRFKKAAILIVATIAMTCITSVLQASAECYSWDSARSVIKKNGLVSAGQVRRGHRGGRMIEFKLCKVRGRYVYRVVTMNPGRVNKMIVDAKSGRTIGRTDGRTSMPAGAGIRMKKPFKRNPFKLFKRKKR